MNAAIRVRLFGAWNRAVPGILFVVLVVTVYADPLFFRRNFAGRDLLVYNLPMEKAIHDAYARGRLPVWMPEVSGGRPLLPNPNAGALYPVRPLLSVLPFPLAMRLFPILHWIAAGIGMIVLLLALGTSRAGAWVGAVTYVFSGVGVSEVFFPHIQPGMSLLPWIVWAVQRPAARPEGKLFVLSLLYGLIFLAGDVFTIGIAIVSSVLWISIETARAQRVRELLLLAGALALAALLAAPQIVATALWIPETNRAVSGMKLGQSLFFSVSPFRLLELLIPFPFGAVWQLEGATVWGWPVFGYRSQGLFASLYAGAFALGALFLAWRLPRQGVRFARVLFVLALIVSIPPSFVTMGSRLGRLESPLPLRNPEKFSVALVFALAIFSAMAFERLRQSARVPRWMFVPAVLLAVAATVATLSPSPIGRFGVWAVGNDTRFLPAAVAQIPPALAEAGLLWAGTLVAVDLLCRASSSARAVSVMLLTLVPITANRKIARTLTEQEIFSPTPFARMLQRLDPDGSYRTLGESLYYPLSRFEISRRVPDGTLTEGGRRSWTYFAQSLWGRGTVFNNDFDVGDLSRVESLRRLSVLAAGFTDSAAFFGSLALRWGVRYRDQRPVAGYAPIGGDSLQVYDEHVAAYPDVRLAERWRETAGGMVALAEIRGLARNEILIESGASRIGSARAGRVRILEKLPERLVVETAGSDPSWLFVLRGFWSHRRVHIDDRPVEVLPAQLAFSAVSVPAGRHQIEWSERVPGGEFSRFGPVVYALVSALLLFRGLSGAAIRKKS